MISAVLLHSVKKQEAAQLTGNAELKEPAQPSQNPQNRVTIFDAGNGPNTIHKKSDVLGNTS